MLVRQLAGERGLTFAARALELFTLFTGGDRRIVANELEKLDLYTAAASGGSSEETVRLLVPMSRAGIIWELGSALSERNVRRALEPARATAFPGRDGHRHPHRRDHPHRAESPAGEGPHGAPPLSKPQQPFFFGKTLERCRPRRPRICRAKKTAGSMPSPLGLAAIHAAALRSGAAAKSARARA